jgi:hypothetical protein
MPQEKSQTDITSTVTPETTSIRQLSVFLQNRVGALLALTRLLEDHSIEILGLSMQDTTEMTLVRLVLSDPEAAGMLFIERGIPYAECRILVVELSELGRRLKDCLSALLEVELNIEFCYPLLVRPRQHPVFALHCDDLAAGSTALNRAGFIVLGQDDLSR